VDHLLFAVSESSGALQNLAMIWSFMQGIIGLGVIIFVHELGHFLVAKACGVKCEKFYVGFDVPISIGSWSVSSLWKMQWGETEYGIGTIPLGGYVKMLGQDDDPSKAEEESDRTKIETTDEQGNEQLVVDPRSYTAKSVPQRMAIISAGVVFNIIFGVIFAAIAYNLGVPYTPCEISWVKPGSPAWVSGISPGDEIVGLSETGKRREHLRFVKDMTIAVAYNGGKEPMPFVVEHPDGSVDTVMVTPAFFRKGQPFPKVGVAPMRNLELIRSIPVPLKEIYGSDVLEGLADGDKLIEVNGQSVESYLEYAAYEAQHPTETLDLKFERTAKDKSTSEHTAKLPPVPFRDTGLVMEISPIRSIRKGSPAQKAGLKIGDLITSINGEPLGNGYLLPVRQIEWAGKEIELIVQRGTEELTFQLAALPLQGSSMQYLAGDEVGLDSIGVTFDLGIEVVSVAEGSAASEVDIQPGDEIILVEFEGMTEEAKKFNAQREIGEADVKLKSDKIGWQAVQSTIQSAHPDTELILSIKKADSGEDKNVKISSRKSETEFVPDRPLYFSMITETQYADSLGDSLYLGVREVGEGMQQVYMTLKKLASRDISITGLGGPVTILAAASSESSQGFGRLLTFLTFISANLAVINFLPIPVLDGGHMVFLLYEGIRGKPINEKWMIRLTYVGLAMVLTLMVTVLSLDFFRFFPWL